MTALLNNVPRGLLMAILVLVALNVVLTAIQLGVALRQPNSATVLSAETVQSRFTDAEVITIAKRITEPYNNDDMDGLYSVLDDLAKAQLPKNQFDAQLLDLREIVGNVESAAYIGTQKVPNTEGGLNMHQLNYVVKLTGGRFSSGTMTITVVERDSGPGIVGFLINGRRQ